MLAVIFASRSLTLLLLYHLPHFRAQLQRPHHSTLPSRGRPPHRIQPPINSPPTHCPSLLLLLHQAHFFLYLACGVTKLPPASRGSASTRKNGIALAKPMDFAIFQDKIQDENQRPLPDAHQEGAAASGEPFKIWYEELQGEDTGPRAKPTKQSTRRGITFSSTPGGSNAQKLDSEDVDTLRLPDVSHYPEFTIEYQAKHDQTLAPLDHFSQHAMMASTPFTGGQNSSVSRSNQPLETSNGLAATASSTSDSITGSLASTLGAVPVTPRKDLSPIMEGSNEGSNDDMKSLQNTAASHSDVMLRSRHASSHMHSQVPEPVHEAMEDCNVSMQDDEQRQQQQEQQQQQLKPPHSRLDADLDQSCHHQIDTTTYIPDQEQEEATQALLSASIRIDPKDPFDDATINHFLCTLNPSIESYPNYERRKIMLPLCENDFPFDEYITFDKCIGEGGYAKVWKVFKFPDIMSAGSLSGISQQDKALKIQKSGGQWEFYISSVLLQRLRQLNRPVDVVRK
ncbi:mitotic checkpoint serine/threonine-protein kinase BUB1-like [Elysia marginata]|uniref:Mitotic checkpoint serine/threonine-protein kinase BUB1-like n=1 Tax=Elysia marginata TaxID=1093978 RepID=A0AAV4EDM9_9GAST|nr:mitotic checkpoint serine/threonine-protein kinase BUB1-like [Elysia marginata]